MRIWLLMKLKGSIVDDEVFVMDQDGVMIGERSERGVQICSTFLLDRYTDTLKVSGLNEQAR